MILKSDVFGWNALFQRSYEKQCKMLQIRDLRSFADTTLPLLGEQWTHRKVRAKSDWPTRFGLETYAAVRGVSFPDPEMEFWDINLTKGMSLMLHAIHCTFYWRILKKTICFSGFNNPRNKKTRVVFFRTENRGQKARQKLESEKTRVYAQKPRLKMPFKNSITEFRQIHRLNFLKQTSLTCP